MRKIYKFSAKLYQEKYHLTDDDDFNFGWAKEADGEKVTVIYSIDTGGLVRAKTESGYDVKLDFDCCIETVERTEWDEIYFGKDE